MKLFTHNALDEADALIKKGEASRALIILASAQSSKELRKELLQLEPIKRGKWAQLVRRAGRPDIAIKGLFPFIRGLESQYEKPSELETLEYASALTFLGMESEALELLSHLKAKNPLKELYTCFALFARWRYQEAKPLLAELLKQLPDSEYLYRVAQVNLLSALVFLGHDKEAIDMASNIIAAAESEKQHLLLGNAHELLAQVYIRMNRLSQAREALNRSESLLFDVGSTDSLMVVKWRALLNIKENSSVAPLELANVVELARSRKHFETIRDFQYNTALILEDEALLKEVIAGTPFPSFFERAEFASSQWKSHSLNTSREQLNFVFKGPLTLRERVATSEVELSQDKQFGQIQRRDLDSYRGRTPEKLIHLLMSDFFRPFSQYRIWEALSEGRYFNPDSSPNWVHQMIYQARQVIKHSNLPLQIMFREGFHELEFRTATRIQVLSPLELTSPADEELSPLLKTVNESTRGLRSSELAKILGRPHRTIQRQLKKALELGLLSFEGKAKGRRYLKS